MRHEMVPHYAAPVGEAVAVSAICREEQQATVPDRVASDDHDVGRLEVQFATRVAVLGPRGPSARSVGGHSRDVGIVLQARAGARCLRLLENPRIGQRSVGAASDA